MTIAEIHQEVRIGLDKVESLQLGEILSEEIDVFLNRCQDILVEKIFKSGKLDEIMELFTPIDLTLTSTPSNIYGNKAYSVDISSYTDYLFHASSSVKHTRTAYPVIASTEYIGTEYIVESDAILYKSDIYNHPTFKNPKVFQNGIYLILICDYFSSLAVTSNGFKLNYIAEPDRFDYSVSQNTNLNDRLHRKIIDLAIQFMLDPLENPRIQINSELLKEKI